MDSPPKDAEFSSLIHKGETDPKQLASSSVSDPSSDVHMPPKAKKTRIGFEPPVSSSAFDSLIPWDDVIEPKPTILYESSFLQQQPLPSQSPYVANSAPTLMEDEMKPSYETCVNADEFLMPQDKNSTVILQDLVDVSAPSVISSNVTNDTETMLRSSNWELPESHHSGFIDTDLDFSWIQNEHFLANTSGNFQNFQFQDYSCSPSLLSELPPHLWFGNEPEEYTLMIDNGLFIS